MRRETQIAVRLTDDERVIVEEAARAEDRSASALVRRALLEWLRQNGWIKKDE